MTFITTCITTLCLVGIVWFALIGIVHVLTEVEQIIKDWMS